ncbi:RagB/SusD family nutrient uptake outer membrane protein [Chitinophaga horti]|uniref:RagB/SusD family nutrient uptake outer membrane protein n=1 Tax=Chitinophaga horti TaxID=2920382 RepID=A0ABY6J7Y6_9BACT|nr:RagB/SusD family nutrient uptake outer membrane protein [Chitinophaga horti]UYQ95798.1 RagB/SusD family nutrient uptake outer membrane protein [Chitinophaga horti]
MKTFSNYIWLGVLLLFAASCSKWIDVKPKTQVEAGEFFKNQLGFQEGLNGVYLQMNDRSLYGREMTFGLADALGGQYVLGITTNVAYQDAQKGIYDGYMRTLTDSIWGRSYTAIANLNKLITAIDMADSAIFSGNNYRVIKGEAYGLRAFLHFDLLRWFGKSYAVGQGKDTAIVYKKLFNTQIPPRESVASTIANVLADLGVAEEALKADIAYTGAMTADRRLRFNYYAVKALQARVYLWADDNTNALKAAEEVIAAQGKFPWVTSSAISIGNDLQKDRVFTTEHIFGLFTNDMNRNTESLLDTSKFTNQLTIDANRVAEQFETSSGGNVDWRNIYLIRNVATGTGPKLFFGKLYQPSGYTVALAKRMPLIRIPEMYYIAAEALIATNPGKAIGYLNTVRKNRGLATELSATLTADQIHNEIRKEYRKEFPLEGQVYFYYKRRNATTIPGATGTFSAARYLPLLPLRELEYGR